MAKSKKPTEQSSNEDIATLPSKSASKDAANTEYDEYLIKKETELGRFTGCTVMKVQRVCRMHPVSAERLNQHAGNSNLAYFEKGTYKVSDVIPVSVMRQVAPGFNWGGKKEDE